MEHGFKEGDLVKVVRKPSKEELDGWNEDEWVSSMNDYVSAVGKIEYFQAKQTACIRFDDESDFHFGYPVFSLEKVNGHWDENKGGPVIE